VNRGKIAFNAVKRNRDRGMNDGCSAKLQSSGLGRTLGDEIVLEETPFQSSTSSAPTGDAIKDSKYKSSSGRQGQTILLHGVSFCSEYEYTRGRGNRDFPFCRLIAREYTPN